MPVVSVLLHIKLLPFCPFLFLNTFVKLAALWYISELEAETYYWQNTSECCLEKCNSQNTVYYSELHSCV